MMHDSVSMNPRGHVKIELYNEKDGVFFTKEKHNLIVMNANKIIANMMADPTKTSRIHKVDKGDTNIVSDADGFFSFALSVQSEIEKTVTQELASSNTEQDITLNGVSNITELKSVSVGGTPLVINEDVFIKDAEAGILHFEVAPTATLTVVVQMVNDKMNKIVEGTETITIAGEVWKRADVPKDTDKTYAIDYKKGIVKFENTKANIEVAYDVAVKYALGFMAVGGKPEGHPDYKPVSFNNSDKLKPNMPEEFLDGRVPILFPSEIVEGEPEIDILPTKPIATEEVTKTFSAVDDGTGSGALIYDVDDSGKKMIRIKSVKNVTDSENPVDVTTDVVINDPVKGEIKFNNAPTIGDSFEIVFDVQKDNTHLTYQLSQSPVIELVSVKLAPADGSTNILFNVVNSGLSMNEGDVWLLNPNAGILQFKEGVPVDKPGQLTIEYRVNSGTVVKFVADFPKGVPGPVQDTQIDHFTVNGSTTFLLSHPVMKDAQGNFIVSSVTSNGNPVQSYTVHPDGTMIDVTGVVDGDSVDVKYKYLKDTHDIYQVAMFDGLDKAQSKMFNISGIGPITKDPNTGMRVTWSVTF